jgi:Trk K+ transport system NAD-binding subunit
LRVAWIQIVNTWQRRSVGYLLFLIGVLVVTALAYQWGMRVYEDAPRTFLESLQFTVEMFTTTGFGGDSDVWTTPQLNAFITVMDLLGMALLIGALPVLASPFLEEAFSTTVPRTLEDDLSDHVVICSNTSRVESLIAELDSLSVPYVMVEADRDRAVNLYEDGHRVIRADPESTAGLEAARLGTARALIADVSDRVDASIVLAAKELADDVPVVSVVEDPDTSTYHRLAGADTVLSPRPLLGESLASKVTAARETGIDEAIEIDDELELAEVPVRQGSGLAGATLAESDIRERTGVNVIGVWYRGEFDAALSADAELTPGTVLLVSGRPDQLNRLVDLTRSEVRQFDAGETVIVGHGKVGQTVATALDEAEIPYTTVDRTDADGVDVVGDATDPETLSTAGVEGARTVVLALPDDTTAEFATLVVRDLSPDTEIIARVDESESIPKMYRAGADYALSLATVSGRMSASHLLSDHDVLSLDRQVEVVRTSAPEAVGRTVDEADIRSETGATVVAIERNGGVLTDIGPDTRIDPGDELVVVGSDENVRAFEDTFGRDG